MANDPFVKLTWHAHFPGEPSLCATAGELSFPQAPPALRAERTADGLALTLPMEVNIVRSGAPFQVSQIRAVILHNRVEVGTAFDVNTYGYGRVNGALVARLPSNVIHRIETVRAGGSATFELRVTFELCRLIRHVEIVDGGDTPKAKARRDSEEDTDPVAGFIVLRSDMRSEDTRITVTYPRETWVNMLNQTGVGDNVVVEIALPPAPPPPWDTVWTPLRHAKSSLQTGGETATTNVITLCRQALEAWRKIEGEDRGPGWPSPTDAERKARTRKQRVDVLRWDIHQVAHDVVHNVSGSPTRDEAVLVLSTVASLLAIRNP